MKVVNNRLETICTILQLVCLPTLNGNSMEYGET